MSLKDKIEKNGINVLKTVLSWVLSKYSAWPQPHLGSIKAFTLTHAPLGHLPSQHCWDARLRPFLPHGNFFNVLLCFEIIHWRCDFFPTALQWEAFPTKSCFLLFWPSQVSDHIMVWGTPCLSPFILHRHFPNQSLAHLTLCELLLTRRAELHDSSSFQ